MVALRALLVAAIALSLLLPLTAGAASYRDVGDYRVHYSAFNSTVIAPDIAKAYGLSRSDYRGILNITVQRREGQEPYPATNARVKARATNLAEQTKSIEMKRIEEGQAVYYIGEFAVTDREVLDFFVDVTPEGDDQSFSLQFRQQFFTN